MKRITVQRLVWSVVLFSLVASCGAPAAQPTPPPTATVRGTPVPAPPEAAPSPTPPPTAVVREAPTSPPPTMKSRGITPAPQEEATPTPVPAAPEIGDEGKAALVYVSEMHEIPMDRLTVVAETEANYPITGVQLSGLKIRDEETGEVYGAYVDENLEIVDIRQIQESEQAAYFETYGKLEPELHERLQEAAADEKIQVGIWLTSAERPAERPPGPEVSEEEFEAIFRQMLAEKEKEYEQLRQPVMEFLREGKERASIIYLSKYAPLVFANVSAEMIEGLQKMPEVNQIFLSKEYEPLQDSAAVTAQADAVWAEGITGSGVKVAVVEADAVEFENPHLKHGPYFSSSYSQQIIDSYAGPDTSADGVKLTDFSVSGSPKVGALLTVKFILRNTIGSDMIFDPYGIFAACRDPEGGNRDFGHWTFPASDPLLPGQGAGFEYNIIVDQPGTWNFWPAYFVDGYWGPFPWHPISVQVIESDTPMTLGSYAGPGTSSHGVELTDFSVTGSPYISDAGVGAILTVEYAYKNTTGADMTFDPHGIFVACRDPDNDNRDFGHTATITLGAAESVTRKAEIIVDEVGDWRFWPTYSYEGGWGNFGMYAISVDVADRTAIIGDHATLVASVIASTHDTYKGIAYGADLLSADAPNYWDASLIAATEWAIENGASVINNSWGLDNGLAMHALDRYVDHLVWHYWVTVVQAAGNDANGYGTQTGNVCSPGLAYNVITVGAIDDRNTGADLLDDVMADYSSYKNPESDNDDREKPEVAAVGSSITGAATSAPWTGYTNSGTSFAAPQVAGQAALLMERVYWFKWWPETVKAVIMASAVHNITGTTRLSDKDGTGGIDCAKADEIVRNNRMISLDLEEDEFPWSYEFDVTQGQKVRVVIAWNSHPESGLPPNIDPLESDLDLHIYGPEGNWITSSQSWDNNYEIVEFEAESTGTYTAEIHKWRFDGSYEYVGLAYSLD